MGKARFLKAEAVLEVARQSRLKNKQSAQDAVNLLLAAGVTYEEFNDFVSELKEGRGQDRVCTDEGCIVGGIWRDWNFLEAALRGLGVCD